MAMRFCLLTTDALNIDEFVVIVVNEYFVLVQYEGESAGHTRAEIHACRTQNRNHAAGHVLAAVIAGALDHRMAAAVAHSETFAGDARGEQAPTGSPVQAGIADNRRIAGHVGDAFRRVNRNPSTRHALTDVVVALAGGRAVGADFIS